MQIKKTKKTIDASSTKNYDEAQKHIKAAIDILAACGKNDEVAKDSIANLGVVMFDLKVSIDINSASDVNPMPRFQEISDLLEPYGLYLGSANYTCGAGKNNYYSRCTIDINSTKGKTFNDKLAYDNYKAVKKAGYKISDSDDGMFNWIEDIFKSAYPDFEVNVTGWGHSDNQACVKVKLSSSKI